MDIHKPVLAHKAALECKASGCLPSFWLPNIASNCFATQTQHQKHQKHMHTHMHCQICRLYWHHDRNIASGIHTYRHADIDACRHTAKYRHQPLDNGISNKSEKQPKYTHSHTHTHTYAYSYLASNLFQSVGHAPRQVFEPHCSQ